MQPFCKESACSACFIKHNMLHVYLLSITHSFRNQMNDFLPCNKLNKHHVTIWRDGFTQISSLLFSVHRWMVLEKTGKIYSSGCQSLLLFARGQFHIYFSRNSKTKRLQFHSWYENQHQLGKLCTFYSSGTPWSCFIALLTAFYSIYISCGCDVSLLEPRQFVHFILSHFLWIRQ